MTDSKQRWLWPVGRRWRPSAENHRRTTTWQKSHTFKRVSSGHSPGPTPSEIQTCAPVPLCSLSERVSRENNKNTSVRFSFTVHFRQKRWRLWFFRRSYCGRSAQMYSSALNRPVHRPVLSLARHGFPTVELQDVPGRSHSTLQQKVFTFKTKD